MTKDIKEILGRLDFNEWEVDLYKVPITWCEMYDIRDYITNLQEENQKLVKVIDTINNYKDAYRNVLIANKMLEKENQKLKNNMSGITMEEYTRALNNYQELKETNEEHLKINGDLRKENQKLVNVINELEKYYKRMYKLQSYINRIKR